MMSNLCLQAGRSYGFRQAVEDRWLRDFERSQAEGGAYLVEEMAETAVEREGLVHGLTAWLSSLAHSITAFSVTALEVRRRHA